MSLSRKNPKKRGNVKNKKTRGKHTKSTKQMGGENNQDDYNLMHIFGNPNSRYGVSRVSASSNDVETFIEKYNQEGLSEELYTFFTSKKTLTENKDVYNKNEENTKTERNHGQTLPDNIKNKMWTDYINELCKKVEKKLDDNIKEAEKESKTKETTAATKKLEQAAATKKLEQAVKNLIQAKAEADAAATNKENKRKATEEAAAEAEAKAKAKEKQKVAKVAEAKVAEAKEKPKVAAKTAAEAAVEQTAEAAKAAAEAAEAAAAKKLEQTAEAAKAAAEATKKFKQAKVAAKASTKITKK